MKFSSTVQGVKTFVFATALIASMAMAEEFSLKGAKGQVGKDGDVLKSAVYDANKGVMTLEIESDNACNYSQASLRHTKSGKATFGPHFYNVVMGISTMKGCGQRSVATIKIPFDKAKAHGSVRIALPGGSALIASGIEKFDYKRKAMNSEGGQQSSASHKNLTPSTEAPMAPHTATRRAEENLGRD